MPGNPVVGLLQILQVQHKAASRVAVLPGAHVQIVPVLAQGILHGPIPELGAVRAGVPERLPSPAFTGCYTMFFNRFAFYPSATYGDGIKINPAAKKPFPGST